MRVGSIRDIGLLLLFGAALALMWVASPAAVAQDQSGSHTVCPAGCDFDTIQGAVNASSPGDTIRLLFTVPHTEGDIVVDRSLTIEGLGPTKTIVQAAVSAETAGKRVFYIVPNQTVRLSGLTVRHGDTPDDGSGIYNEGSELMLDAVHVLANSAGDDGGGIFNEGGQLTLLNSRLANNRSGRYGGGIFSTGSLYIYGSELFLNEASQRGGGLYNGGQTAIWNSELEMNKVSDYGIGGGGAYSTGPLRIVATNLESNSVGSAFTGGTQGGGAVFVRDSDLSLVNSQVRLNEVKDFMKGGGLYLHNSNAFISRTTIEDNRANGLFGDAGGVYAWAGSLQIDSSTLSKNKGGYGGGLLTLNTEATLNRTTFSNNEALNGGGAYLCGSAEVLQLNNVTISGNKAETYGGGLFVCDKTEVAAANVTISGNRADDNESGEGEGGGVFLFGSNGQSGKLIAGNSLIAANEDGGGAGLKTSPDCFGTISSVGYNLIGTLGTAVIGDPPCSVSGDATGNLIGVGAFLGPLADNGGPTQTHGLGLLSPAIDAGDPAGCMEADGVPLLTDQRGGLRVGRCDIGAFEVGALLEKGLMPAVFSP